MLENVGQEMRNVTAVLQLQYNTTVRIRPTRRFSAVKSIVTKNAEASTNNPGRGTSWRHDSQTHGERCVRFGRESRYRSVLGNSRF